ncbi:autotransporter protein [Helicobacter cholecystus]|uniref:autotransporter outer membrane beta-barrel domain-containing protein n=1 Tax=Helicobacter cholecystus TaxID=45498 RepID=UPI000CF14D63|nr:autotransporter outer membrane beta-barrel domain-containing protein [Helicobacter cholecystus]VEJ25827.1 autotransporter protein [Helicobacter cholecystus]
MTIDEIIGGINKANTLNGIMLMFDHANLTIGSMSAGDNTHNGVIFGGTTVVNGNISKTGSGTNNFVLTADSSLLTLRGANNTIQNLVIQSDTKNGTGLTLDASLNNIQTTIDTIYYGDRLNLVFAGVDAQRSINLNLDTTKNNQLRSVSAISGLNNVLTLNGNGTMSIDDIVQVAEGGGLTFSLGTGTTLDLKEGMSGNGETSIRIDSGYATNTATLAGGIIQVKNVEFSGTSSQLTLQADQTYISNLLANASASTLVLDGSLNPIIAEIQEIKGNSLKVLMRGGGTTTSKNFNNSKRTELYLNGGVIESVGVESGFFNSIYFSSGTTTITSPINHTTTPNSNSRLLLSLEGGNLVLGSEINISADNSNSTLQTRVDIQIDSGTLSLSGQNNTINNLSVTQGTIDLAMTDSQGKPILRTGQTRDFKTLNINNLSITDALTFNLYVNSKTGETNKADKVILKNRFQDSGTAIFTVMGDTHDILAITYDSNKSDNIQIGEGMQNVNVMGGESLIGYDVIKAQIIKTDDGKVYLGSSINQGVASEIKDVVRSALTVNYDLYLANFNSLNKRMGELRDNPNTQGVWARIFGGSISNDFGAGSKTDYVTAQGGYDYALGAGENAKNYTGVTFAYSRSWTKSNTLNIQANNSINNTTTIALKDVSSSMVEVGVYNSYVADSGWYNDAILKFNYIMGVFSMTDNPSLESKTNNFAMVLSDEFGYRYKFGGDESYYIDPQVELALGYFNQSDFNRAIQNTSSTLQASQDSIFTLRTRAGAVLGKKLNVEKGFASLYVGGFYEYDYINGGNAQILSNSRIITSLGNTPSNGRVVMNLGSNIDLTGNARLYIDVERSFEDKQKTFMQFNFGARYGF